MAANKDYDDEISTEELLRQIQEMEVKIKQLDHNIEGLKSDCQKKQNQSKELKTKFKEVEKSLVKKNCSECFKYMISSKYGQISFNHILKIVHDEIILCVRHFEK